MPRKYREEEGTYPYARRMAILDLVFPTKNDVRTSDLVARFKIAPNLLAYDLRQLEDRGLVERGYGWVRRRIPAIEDLFTGSEFVARMGRAREPKERIAQYIAANLVQAGNQAVLDAGTTSFLVGRLLVELKKEVTLWTNNLPAFLYVLAHSDMVCHLVGGTASRAHAALVGEIPAQQIAETTFDLPVLTPKGLVLKDLEVALKGPLAEEIAGIVGEGKVREAVCLVLFNEDQTQHQYKRMMVQTANRLAVAVDQEQLAAVGHPFLTIIIRSFALQVPPCAVRTRGPDFPKGMVRSRGRRVDLTSQLLPLLEHKSPTVGPNAARAAGHLGLETAVPLLVSLLKDPSPEVQQAAGGGVG